MPSIFTTFNLFLGYLALTQVLKSNYITASYLLVFGVVMDGFDGTIARLTKTESNFGMQLDSLVDAVTFGLVTAILIFTWGLPGINIQVAKIIGFIFLSAGVIRLARFNVLKEAEAVPANIFVGLPIPLATLAVVSVVLIFEKAPEAKLFSELFALYILFIAFLMISNIKYRTIKKVNPKYQLLGVFLVGVVLASAIMYPNYAIPVLTGLYLISPLFFAARKQLRKRKRRMRKEPTSE